MIPDLNICRSANVLVQRHGEDAPIHAANPRVRETAAKAARVVVGEARQIARREDKARAAGQALRRVMNKLQGDR